jgi:hypothetical protein
LRGLSLPRILWGWQTSPGLVLYRNVPKDEGLTFLGQGYALAASHLFLMRKIQFCLVARSHLPGFLASLVAAFHLLVDSLKCLIPIHLPFLLGEHLQFPLVGLLTGHPALASCPIPCRSFLSIQVLCRG